MGEARVCPLPPPPPTQTHTRTHIHTHYTINEMRCIGGGRYTQQNGLKIGTFNILLNYRVARNT